MTTRIEITTPEGKRSSATLDPQTLAALSKLAEPEGITPRQWAERAIREAGDTNNATAALRAAIMDALLAGFVFGDRATPDPAATGFEQANTPDDRDFADMVTAAQINGTVDLIGCTVMAGVNECGNVAFYIRNGWRDGLNMTISTPMTPEEWTERMGIDAF